MLIKVLVFDLISISFPLIFDILDFFFLQITNYYVVSVNRISLIRRLLDIVKI